MIVNGTDRVKRVVCPFFAWFPSGDRYIERGNNMVLLTAENIRKSYGTRVIFDDISFSIHEGDKIGVVGVNGTGKSTLLKIVAGVNQADSGKIITMNGMRMGYLPQSPVFRPGTTVLEQVFYGDNPVMALVREYESTMKALETNPTDEKLTKQAAQLSEKMDKAEAWSLESEAKNILTRLGISDFSQPVETLSGGQRKRVALAAALIAPVDLLILDEPTNHIDNDTVEWLEKHLEKYSKALLMVTHDRYFLDRVANRMHELEKGKIYTYQANFTKYLEMKAEREERLLSEEKKRRNFCGTNWNGCVVGHRRVLPNRKLVCSGSRKCLPFGHRRKNRVWIFLPSTAVWGKRPLNWSMSAKAITAWNISMISAISSCGTTVWVSLATTAAARLHC